MYPLNYLPPMMMVRPYHRKYIFGCNVMHEYEQDTIGELHKYPLGGPRSFIFFKWSRIIVKVPTATESSV